MDAVRERVGEDYPLIYRITTDEFLADGLTINDTADFSKYLVEHGVDAINVSGSTYAAGRTSSGADDILGVYVENANTVRQTINKAVPVFVANRIKTPDFAESVIRDGKVLLHTKADVDLIEAEQADTVIIASGSVPITPAIPGSDPNFVINAMDVLMGLRSVGNKAVIIGGGSVGIETGEMLVKQGKNITVIEMLPEVLKDLSATLKAGLLYRVSQTNLQILTGEKVVEIIDYSVITDKRTIADVDTVIMAVGYKSNNGLIQELKDRNINFEVVGDAAKPRKIYEAVKEGFEVAYKL